MNEKALSSDLWRELYINEERDYMRDMHSRWAVSSHRPDEYLDEIGNLNEYFFASQKAWFDGYSIGKKGEL